MRIFRKMGIVLLIFFALLIILILIFVPIQFFWKRASDGDVTEKLIIAHRGASGIAPENTMPAIEKAMTSEADYIEIDVQLSKDKKLILMHDRDVSRTTNGEGKVSELDWSYLKQLDAGYKFDERFRGTRIPLLEEVIQKVDGRVKLLIEIKDGKNMDGIDDKVVNIIREYRAAEWCEVQSFSDDILESIHKHEPSIRLHKLFVMKLRFLPLIIDEGITGFSFDKYDYIYAFNIHRHFGNASLLASIHELGKKTYAWGCHKQSSCKLEEMEGWDGVITDHPEKYRPN